MTSVGDLSDGGIGLRACFLVQGPGYGAAPARGAIDGKPVGT
ncbi:hypothetical protein HMPREF1979_00075, partial [Actinomyces johnsonii F0542]